MALDQTWLYEDREFVVNVMVLDVIRQRLAARMFRQAEWAELLTNIPAIGLANAFLQHEPLGFASTTVSYVASTFGTEVSALWMTIVAVLPLLSMCSRSWNFRMISTLFCGYTWTMIVSISIVNGAWFTIVFFVALAAMIALARSHLELLDARWPASRWKRE